MTYRPGQRVALVHTTDPYTPLRPGDQGTLRAYHPDQQTVDVDWDNGSHLSMCLDAGDRIRPLDPAETSVGDQAPAPGGRWPQVLDAIRAAGAAAGCDAADWWGQDTVGGRATGDVRPTARRILAGIDDGDPAVLDALPTLATAGTDTPSDEQRYAEATPQDAPAWHELTAQQHDEALEAYRDGFDTAVADRVAELCRMAASPTGDGRDLSHLHPDQVRLGSVGVFAGDWAWTTAPDGELRIPVGFVGTLVDTWNGWAVFSCTRTVAEAIVADQQRCREAYRQQLRAGGVAGEELDRQLDQAMASLAFDGDTIVADQRGVYDDPEAIERITPDRDGRYVVMGRSWCWEAVDPADCDRIVGDLPVPGEQQQFAMLTHTPDMRVPHDRLTVIALRKTPTHNGIAFTAELALDGMPVGTIDNDGNGGQTVLHSPNSLFGWRGMRAYLTGCRFRGEPVSEERLLEALVDEYDLAQALAQAQQRGETLARLLDEHGYTLHVQHVPPAQLVGHNRDDLVRRLRAAHHRQGGDVWVIWSGTAWRHLAAARPDAT